MGELNCLPYWNIAFGATNGYRSGQTNLTNRVFSQLTSLRASKAYQIESYFENICKTLSEDLMVVAAMQEFKAAYRQLEVNTPRRALVNAILFAEAEVNTWRTRVPKLLIDLSRLFLVLLGTVSVLAAVWNADLAGQIIKARRKAIQAVRRADRGV